MTSRSKTIILSLLAVLAMSGLASASASAGTPNWRVNGVFLTAAQSRSLTAAGTFLISDTIKGQAIVIRCKAVLQQSVKGGSPGTDTVKSLTLSECNTESPITCKLVEPPEAANLTWPSKLVVNNNVISDDWSEVAFVIKFMNAGGCPLPGTLATSAGLSISGRWVNGSRPQMALQGNNKITREGEEGEGTTELSLTFEPPEGETLEAGEETTSGHEWLKDGYLLTQPEEVLSEGGAFALNAIGKKIECKKVKGTGDVSPGVTGLVLDAHFLECTTGHSGCLVASPGQTKGLILVTNAPDSVVLAETQSGSKVLGYELKENTTTHELVTLDFEADATGDCSNYGTSTKVKGSVIAEVDNATEELIFPTPELEGDTLEAFGVAAELTGSVKQMLAGGGKLTAD